MDVVHLLNRYYAQVGRVVEEHGGVINTYMGDGFMALFGLERDPKPALSAIRAGVALLRTVEELRPYVASAYDRRFRIGLASRIESANKAAGTEFLLSEITYAAVQDDVLVGRTFTVPVKGKAGEYRLYEVLGLKSCPTPADALAPWLLSGTREQSAGPAAESLRRVGAGQC